MDRKILKAYFRQSRVPDWTCPTCNKGVLRLKKGSFVSEEISSSRDHSHEAWDPDWIVLHFSCQLQCNSDTCKEVVFSTGKGTVEPDYYYDEEGTPSQEWTELYSPTYFEPPLNLMPVPEKCPSKVSEPLLESFKSFFSSPHSALNCVRIAVEELLTDLGIKRYNRGRGKMSFVSLHDRINSLPSKFEEVKEMLLAIKWLGNAGSHSVSKISRDDVLDAYEFIEHVLKKAYANNDKELLARARKVNRAKGPVTKARGRRKRPMVKAP